MPSIILNTRLKAAALHAALLTTSAVEAESHEPALREAVLALEGLRATPLSEELRGEASRAELRALARELSASAKLIAQGLAFAQGMARLLAPATAAYRPDGEPIPFKIASTIVVRG
jgi:hypothetical protein